MRLAFVVLSFFGGLGVVLYLAGWLLIPAEGTDRSIGERWLGEVKAGSGFGIFLIVAALLILLISLDVSGTGLGWAVALLVLGVLLYRGDNPQSPAGAGDTETPSDEAAPVGTATTDVPTVRPERPRRRARPRRVRPPSMLGRYTMAATLIGLGVLALLDNAGVLFPDARHYLALAVVIIGAGLLVGSVWGRSRILIAVGLVLAFLMGIATVGEAVDAFTDEVRTFRPTTAEEVSGTYQMDSGTLVVDLTEVDWSNQATAIEVELGAGRIEIEVPAGVSLIVDARAGVGQVDVVGRTSEGLGVGRSIRIAGAQDAGDITLDVRVGAGQITVTQESNS
jgi:hypothetical protein